MGTLVFSLTWIAFTISLSVLLKKLGKLHRCFNEQMKREVEKDLIMTEKQMQSIITVRDRELKRMKLFIYLLVAVSILLFFYTAYKYLWYSADCNPINNMPLEVNSFLNMIGLGCAYQFWLIPIVAYFWPTG